MTVKIEKVTFTITNLDDENAGVHVTTDPSLPDDLADLEESPAYDLGAAVWEYIQQMYEGEVGQLQ